MKHSEVSTGLSIFVSSRMEELKYVRQAIQEAVESLQALAIRFEEFPAYSRSPQDAYESKVTECDIFLFVAGDTLSTAIKKEYKLASDLRKPVIVFCEGEKGVGTYAQLINELKAGGEEIGTGDPDIEQKTFMIFDSLKKLRDGVMRSLTTEVLSQLRGITDIMPTKQALYGHLTDMVRKASHRIYTIEDSPILFFGARPYTNPSGERIHYEATLESQLSSWLDRCTERGSSHRTMKLIFSSDRIAEELLHISNKNRRKDFKEILVKRINELTEKQAPSNYRFEILPIKEDKVTRLYVADDRYALWVAGHEPSHTIVGANARIADSLVQICDKMCGEAVVEPSKVIKAIEEALESAK